jgi:hypothetical protein
MRKINACLLPSPGHLQTRSLFELVEWLVLLHQSTGLAAGASLQRPDPSALNVILGVHLATADELALIPPGSVVWNTELLTVDDPLIDLLCALAEQNVLWDASLTNCELLAARGVAVRHCMPCYVPGQDRYPARGVAKTIDVVTWGPEEGPRAALASSLRARGWTVECASGKVGAEWEALMASARLYLDVPGPGERASPARQAFLLHNDLAVVGTWAHANVDPSWRGAFTIVDGADVAGVVDACARLLENEELRAKQIHHARARLSLRSAEHLVRALWSEELEAALWSEKGAKPPPSPWEAESPAMVAQMATLLSAGDAEGVLKTAFHVTAGLFFRGEHKGKALFLPAFDVALQQVAHALVSPARHPPNVHNVLHIATEVYETGGHTRVMEDIVRASQEKNHLLILTDIAGRYSDGKLDSEALLRRFDEIGLRVFILQGSSLSSKVRDLVNLVASIAPGNIFLNAHHYDAVAYASIAGPSAPHVHFLHHADHAPSLGATRQDYRHYDLTPACHDACKSYGLTAEMMHLTVGSVAEMAIDSHAPLAGVTCASPEKYQGVNVFSYAHLLASLFDAGVEKMFHVGPISDDQRQAIEKELKDLHQDEKKIVFIGAVPSISDLIQKLPVAFYLNSHPTGGAKALVEVLGLGLPIVMTKVPSPTPLLTPDLTLGAGLVVRDLGDVPAIVKRLKNEARELGKKSRHVFNEAYDPGIFKRTVEQALQIG